MEATTIGDPMYDHEIADEIRADLDEPAHDAHLACVVDALLVGCRVCPRPSPLHRALLDAIVNSTTWRTRFLPSLKGGVSARETR